MPAQRPRIAHCDMHCFPPRTGLMANVTRLKIGSAPAPISGSELNLQQIGLTECSEQVAHQQDHKDCAKPDACASASAPPAVAVVPSAPAEDEQQNNNEDDQHLVFPFTPGFPGLRNSSADQDQARSG